MACYVGKVSALKLDLSWRIMMKYRVRQGLMRLRFMDVDARVFVFFIYL